MEKVVGIIIIVVIIVLIGKIISIYNNLIKRRNRVDNAWAQIDVQLQKRFDLIPNLMETVKGAAKYERETLESIIAARNSYNSATSSDDKIDINNSTEKLFNRLFALHESYPDLKANNNYMKFMDSLSKIEEQISVSRLFYNDTVNLYNDELMIFPNNIIAGLFRFKDAKLLKAAENARENIKVQF